MHWKQWAKLSVDWERGKGANFINNSQDNRGSLNINDAWRLLRCLSCLVITAEWFTKNSHKLFSVFPGFYPFWRFEGLVEWNVKKINILMNCSSPVINQLGRVKKIIKRFSRFSVCFACFFYFHAHQESERSSEQQRGKKLFMSAWWSVQKEWKIHFRSWLKILSSLGTWNEIQGADIYMKIDYNEINSRKRGNAEFV